MLQAISDRVNNAIASIRNDSHKYGVVALVTVLALVWVYQDFSRKVHTQELVSASLLGQTAGLVHRDKVRLADGARSNPGKSGQVLPEKRTPYVPPEATIVVTPKDPTKKLDDLVTIRVEDKLGFTAEPGVDFSVAPIGLGLDFKWFYLEKAGTEVGFVDQIVPVNRWSPTVGLSYRLDKYRMLRNTEFKIEYVPLGLFPIAAGFRVNL